MKTSSARSTSRLTLLFAAMAVLGALVDLHDHDLVPLESGLRALTRFEAAHAQPDGSLHIEAARVVAPSACLGCQLRTSPRVAPTSGFANGDILPDLTPTPIDARRPTETGTGLLPSPRAPPRA